MARRIARKGRYHHGALRRALIDAAIAWVAREGTGGVSLRELAARVGVSHAAPYRHFSNKEALFATVAEEGFTMFRDARLAATGVAYVRFAVDHPGHFKVMFSHLGAPPEDVPNLTAEGASAFQVLFDCVVGAQAAGVLRPGNPLQQSLFAWSGVHGLAMLLVEKCLTPLGLDVPIDKNARRFAEDLIDGLAPRLREKRSRC
jgi:AcrR family transcriptional regulator